MDHHTPIVHSGPCRPYVAPCIHHPGAGLRDAVQVAARIRSSYLDHTGPWDLGCLPYVEAGVSRLLVSVHHILRFALEDREEDHDPVPVDRGHEDRGDIRLVAPSGDSLEVDLGVEGVP